MQKTRFPLVTFACFIIFLLAAGCAAPKPAELAMAPMEMMPGYVHEAPVVVQEAYQYAVANPEILTELPCYCGCGPIGHTSNYACYVAGQDEGGNMIFDSHAVGCSICVDITQDAMRMQREGIDLAEIRQVIDATYARYGPSNIP